MAVKHTSIEAVRVGRPNGALDEHLWDPSTRYLVRDDHPFLDILTKGRPAQFKGSSKIRPLTDLCEPGSQWQRWDFSEEVSRKRRFGEFTEILKVPKGCLLRCYVIPTALLDYRDILTMIEEIEGELNVSVIWDKVELRSDRIWSHSQASSKFFMSIDIIDSIKEEMRVASFIRADPFSELGPKASSRTPLAENALISHWAVRRIDQLRDIGDRVDINLDTTKTKSLRGNPDGRQEKLNSEIVRLEDICEQILALRTQLARFVDCDELGTAIQPGPLLQRDYRLRLLLRAFMPNSSEVISEVEAQRSSYPPVLLTNLWEIWGAVWIAQQFRNFGFKGTTFIDGVDSIRRCSWLLSKDDIEVVLDFEAEPTFIDYTCMPHVYNRNIPALEWAAMNQEIDNRRPYLGAEEKCSPDYLIRITTPSFKSLLVGDATLATPEHHGKEGSSTKLKTQVVEKYKRTIGWVSEGQIVRCHPMGSFVVFPPPTHVWNKFDTYKDARDCMILCPNPKSDGEANRRFVSLLKGIMPEILSDEELLAIGEGIGESHQVELRLTETR